LVSNRIGRVTKKDSYETAKFYIQTILIKIVLFLVYYADILYEELLKEWPVTYLRESMGGVFVDKFIKNLKKEFGKGVAVVGAKSKEIIEATKIKNQIEELKKAKHLAFQEIGETVYQMSRDENYDGQETIKEKCQAVTDLDQQIQDKEVELKGIRQEAQEAVGKTICESCGAAMGDDVKFCSSCGARIVKVEID